MLTTIVESLEELENFYTHVFKEDCIFYAIGIDDTLHPLNNRLCCIFCKSIVSEKCFVLPFDHSESIFPFQKEEILRKINESVQKKYVFDKKNFEQITSLNLTLDINLMKYLEDGKSFDMEEFDTTAHKFIKNNFYEFKNLNKSVPILKHVEKFKMMCDIASKFINTIAANEAFLKLNDELIPVLSGMEKNGIFVNRDKFLENFGNQYEKHITSENLIHTQYFIYTSAGRPSNRFGGINYAALNKENGCRFSFESRFGNNGKLILMDFNAFHPRLIAKLIGYDFPSNETPYEYLAKYYFQKDLLTEEDVKNSKGITFQQLYGGITKEYENIPYFKKTKEFVNDRWEYFMKNGYVETPIFKKKILQNHISDPFPNKLMNYILQSYEMEVGSGVLKNILSFSKNYQSKLVLYTYDSFLIDCCKTDGIDFLKSLKRIVESNNTLPVKVYGGNNYHEMKKD